MNKYIKEKEPITTLLTRLILISLQIATTAAVLYLGYLFEDLKEKTKAQRPNTSIQTEYVIINACDEDFDVTEMKGE